MKICSIAKTDCEHYVPGQGACSMNGRCSDCGIIHFNGPLKTPEMQVTLFRYLAKVLDNQQKILKRLEKQK